MFSYTPGAKYWIGDFINGLPDKQREALQAQLDAAGGRAELTNLYTVPSETTPGATFEIFAWPPFAGNQGYFLMDGPARRISQVNVQYQLIGILPLAEREAISLHWPEEVRPLTEPNNIIIAPDEPPIIKDGKFYWGNYYITDYEIDLWPIDRKLMTAMSARIDSKSSKVFNTRRSEERCAEIATKFYPETKFKIEKAKANKSGYKSSVSVIL
jgi:hypothetical protein